MHNYYMWHGGNDYGNWSLAGESDTAAGAGTVAPFTFGVAADAWNPGHPASSLGGPVASTNTMRYANAAPMHSDGTRNEPRWSHLATLQNLIRNSTGAMLTTPGVAAPTNIDRFGCAELTKPAWGSASGPLQCIVYSANTSDEITFVVGGFGGTTEPPQKWRNGTWQPQEPTQQVSVYGQRLGMPFNTVLIIGADKKKVLWNSSQPAAVDLSAHKINPNPAGALLLSKWSDAANMTWRSATFDAPAGDPTAVLLDLNGLHKGMAFVNGRHVANYELALASCNKDQSLPKPGPKNNSFPQFGHWKPTGWCGNLQYINNGDAGAGAVTDTYPDGGCGQPTQRYYHIPRDYLTPTGQFLVPQPSPLPLPGYH